MYIKVVVNSGAKKEEFVQESEDHFKISVKEKAERNLANNKIIEILSYKFKVGKGKVRIINGHKHPHKLILIDN